MANPPGCEPHTSRLLDVIQQAIRLQQQGKFSEAERLHQAILAQYPEQADALHYLGVLRAQQGNAQEAVRLISRALELRPQMAEAHSNLGNVLQALDRTEAAIASYGRALELKPDYLDAHYNRGTALASVNRHAEAVACFDRVLAISPDHAVALNNRGAALQALNRNEEAIASYDRALTTNPDYAEAFNNRGNALLALNRHEDAVASYERSLALKPAYPEALNNRGAALQALNRHAEAAASYQQAVALNPDYKYALGAAAHSRAHVCDWRDYDGDVQRITEAVRAGKPVIAPFAFLAMSGSSADQLACAATFCRDKHPALDTSLWKGERYRHDRIRLAYLSADFHEHATAYLMAELFEHHDRQRFEITAVSFGPDAPNEMRTRLMAAFDRFVNVRRSSDADVARMLRDAEVDIAVDLKGYTGDSRPGILAHRPAPLQVSYLGYPGTMAADYIDYVLADRIVIPPEQHAHYSEKVVYLPDCYQVNDTRRRIAEHALSRAGAGLPERGFVFCSFNNNYKITPSVFAIWMRLLRRVEGSVLWLLEASAATAANLRREAARRDVDPARLIFAPRVALADHLARHRLADLFLDTLPYNAHTTASDALWSGLPLVTCIGTSFAGRVAASLLTAARLTELITHSEQEYEALALKLATDMTLLKGIGAKLQAQRPALPLFDLDRFRHHIEAAYVTMWETGQRGEPACSFAVAPGRAETPPRTAPIPAPDTSALDISRAVQVAFALHRQGKLEEAERGYREILERAPQNFDAHHYLGILRGQRGDPEEAVRLLTLALERQPRSAEAHCNLGVTLSRLNRHAEALAGFDRALAIHPGYADALYNRAVALAALNRHEEAIAAYDLALAAKPAAGAFYSRGNALQALGRHGGAIASYDQALALQPDHADAHNNRGASLAALERHREALAGFDWALALRPGYAEAHVNRGVALARLNRHEKAMASYDRALAIEPDRAEAHYRRGNLLRVLGRNEEAVASYDRALALKADYGEAFNNRGNALQALRRYADAAASYDRALAIRPEHANASYNRGIVLTKLNRYAEAAASFDRVLQIDPGYNYVLGDAVHARAHACDWSDHAAITARLSAAVRAGALISPFAFLAVSDSPAEQLACARNFGRARYPAVQPPLWNGERYRHERIRIAYLSADFHEHATAYLMAGLFERHDRARFETTAISFGPDLPSAMRTRLERAFDRFIDVRLKSDREVARLLRDMEIDIVVDLKGYTTDARSGILAHRPAPIQVNYLGYPGTMAMDYIDYVVADRIVIPEEHRQFYTEKVVYLPGCYQVNDSRRRIADDTPLRRQAGLPERGFVFCSFNNNYKIAPDVFDVWMRLLRRVDGSVLWLLRGNPAVIRNLRREAEARGVDPKRLMFARRAKVSDHLARHRLANLFLDTLPYNAHTTASDALWAGLPVLTRLGNTFAGRVAASLLSAVGLPELITRSAGEYEELALQLAADPARLQALKDKLAANRLATPLFDTDRFRRHLEAAYTTMWEIHQRGEPPHAFAAEQRN